MNCRLRKAGKRRRRDMNNNSSGCELGEDGRSRREEEEITSATTVDRLTHLPEPIIYHILSFLSTKAAVQTSVLSRAWRSAWKNVPVLDLRSDSFWQYPSFLRFVDNILSLRYPVNAQKITYISRADSSEEARDDSQFGRIVEYALRHDTHHLAFEVGRIFGFYVCHRFSDLFGSNLNCNLRTLELRNITIDSGFRCFGFQRLTTLKLNWCRLTFEKEEDLDPFSNFPCLQNLSLTNSDNRIPRHLRGGSFKVLGLQLLSLKLGLMKFRKFELVAPKLELLDLSEAADWCSVFSELSLPSLVHADILLYPDFMANKKDVISLFQGLHNANHITLHSKTFQVLSGSDEFLEQNPSPFTRLTHLNVRSSSIPYEVVDYFLKGSSIPEPTVKFL